LSHVRAEWLKDWTSPGIRKGRNVANPREELALYGGPKAVAHIEGEGQPKIGMREFMSIAERFGFSDAALARIRASVSDEDLAAEPHLARYSTSYRAETKGVAFERLARQTFGVQHALGVSSGTAALHAAFVAVGVGPGTEVICSAVGFYATAAAVVLSKGIPVFCDVDGSLGMDPAQIEALITPRTVAIAPTHVMGSICDMDPILEVARAHDLKVVEDCAQSPGGRYRGRYVGTLGDVGCFSISAYKIIGGGEGGLVLTDDQRLWERACQLAECGGLWRPDRFAPPRYEGELFSGTNYRMSELEAAIDVIQLEKMPEVVSRYHAVKMDILEQLHTYGEIVPQKLNDREGEIGYLLRFYPETVELGKAIVEALNAEGVPCHMRGASAPPDWHVYSHMFPITHKRGATGDGCPFTCPVYSERGGEIAYARGDCPVADDLFDRCVSIRLNQWYTAEDCRHVAHGIDKVLSAHCTVDPEATAWL
jgi:8-amino-3,8-dideoxy-alpha-D-manno-octulosonate transaminase